MNTITVGELKKQLEKFKDSDQVLIAQWGYYDTYFICGGIIEDIKHFDELDDAIKLPNT